MSSNFFDQIKRIQALAEIGLEYSTIHYDRERYEEIQQIAFDMLEQITDVPVEKIKIAIEEKSGYKTPKVDVRAVVFNSGGQILLIREKADGLWALPGGWADVGYSPRQVAEKECFEEAGLKVAASRLLAVMDKTAQKMPPQFEYVYKLFVACTPQGTDVKPSDETDGAAWFDEHNLPPLSLPRNLESHIRMMFGYYRGTRTEIHLD